MKLSGLSVIIPALNEVAGIGDTLMHVIGKGRILCDDLEVIVVDDGSSDGTPSAVLRMAEKHKCVTLICHDRNHGKGRALRTGFAAAGKPWVLIFDADMQVRIDELAQLPDDEPTFDLALGYRPDRKQDRPHRKFITFTYNSVLRHLLGIRVRDINCPLKLIRRSVLAKLDLRTDGFAIDADLLYAVRPLKVDIREFPVVWHERSSGISKVRLHYTLRLLKELFAIRFRER